MLTKTITYTDFDGNKRTEDFTFNLSKLELMKMQLSEKGGLADRFRDMLNSGDKQKIFDTFEWLILASYGEKSDDGRKFEKIRNGVRLSENFQASPAYEALFFELMENTQSAIDFFNGVIDPTVKKEMNEMKTE